MIEQPQPKPSSQDPTLQGSWSRVQQYLDKLCEALADLDEAGGIEAVAEAQGWRPGKVEKAKASFKAVSAQLGAGLARLKAERRRRG